MIVGLIGAGNMAGALAEGFFRPDAGRKAASASARPMAAATSEIEAMPSTVRSAPRAR